MAVRGGSNIGLIISNIMFALAFITALVLVINVDAKKEEARQEAQAAKANLVAAIGPGVIEQAPGYDAAQMNNQSVVAQLSGQIDTLKRLIGTTTADEQRIRTDLGFESGSILEIKGRMENQLGALSSDNEALVNRVKEQDATIEALRDEIDALEDEHQESLVRVRKDVETYRAQADSYGQDVDRTIKRLEDSRDALEQDHRSERRRLQEDIDRIGQENQVLAERNRDYEGKFASTRLRATTPELLIDGQIVETEPKIVTNDGHALISHQALRISRSNHHLARQRLVHLSNPSHDLHHRQLRRRIAVEARRQHLIHPWRQRHLQLSR